MQFNWPELAEVPDILEELAEVEMHAIQTSGNCIRNVTTDSSPASPRTRSRPAPVLRDHPAVVDVPSGIRLAAAQVQDRGHRRRAGPRRGRRARHRPARVPRREGETGFACWSAAAWAARRSSAR
jgi:hypothetical protein